MNLLVLSSWFPYPPGNGSRIRAYYLLRELVRAGHTIRLVAGLQDDVAGEKEAGLAALREMGIVEVVAVPWKWYEAGKSGKWGALKVAFSPVPRSILETPNSTLTQAITEQMARPTDAVVVLEVGMDAYLPPQMPPNVPLILDGVEMSGLLADGIKQWITTKKATRYWQKRLRRYDAVTTVSREEAEAVRNKLRTSHANPQVVVVPNGVDTGAYGPRDCTAIKPGCLIYNGSPTYGPNREAVLWFAGEVLPRIRAQVPEAHLYVTGHFTPNDAALFTPFSNSVTLTGFVPDLKPLLAQAAVCVVPLLQGGGTRLKILEAWAAGVPVVSTTIGAAGLDGANPGLMPSAHFLQADTTEFFGGSVVRLLTVPTFARDLSENARALVAQRYDWLGIGETLNQVLVETCRAHKPSLYPNVK